MESEAPAGEGFELVPVELPSPLYPGDTQSIKIAVFEAAMARRSGSFSQLATSIFYSKERFTRDPVERSVYGRYIGPLTEAFEAAHGPIIHSFYCENVIAAAALTGTQELCVIPPTLAPHIVPIAELLFECDRLSTEADRVLQGPERLRDLQTTKSLSYGVVVKLLSLLDDPIQQLPRSVIDLHRREARHALDYYQRAADRYAKLNYFRGMLIGTAVSLSIAIGAWLVTHFTPDFNVGGWTFVGCLTAGGVGAVVSVMSRMTFGTLSLDYEAGRPVLTLLGAFRPVIGMVLGAAMWVLTASAFWLSFQATPVSCPSFIS